MLTNSEIYYKYCTRKTYSTKLIMRCYIIHYHDTCVLFKAKFLKGEAK